MTTPPSYDDLAEMITAAYAVGCDIASGRADHTEAEERLCALYHRARELAS